MGQLGKDYVEIGRGYEKVSENYSRPYLLGVNTLDNEKPFVIASGDHHSDFGATKLSVEELVSEKWNKHIKLCNSEKFIDNLKTALKNKEVFPQKFILELIK